MSQTMPSLATFCLKVEHLRQAHVRIDELLIRIARKNCKNDFKELREVCMKAKEMESDIDKVIVDIKIQNFRAA